jgi:TPP-dependent indolepyruvate ferredoxin oxidoreductase alpha subunit
VKAGNEKPVERKNRELNIANPSNLIYKGSVAEYQIKGFKLSQLDSLKVSLRITNSINDFRARVELYDYKQTESVSRKASKLLEVEESQLIEKETKPINHTFRRISRNIPGQRK